MNSMKPLKSAAIVSLAALCIAPLSCLAQSDQGNLYEVVTLVAKPGMTARFEQGLKQVYAYAKSHGDTNPVSAFEVMYGPNDGNVILLIPFKWENVDNPPSYEAGIGPVIEKNIDPYVSSAHTSLMRILPKLGNPAPANATPQKFYEIIDVRIRPGKADDFLAAVGQLSTAEQKYNSGPNPVEIFETVAGGDADEVIVAIGHPSFVDFAHQGKSNMEVLTQAYGGPAALAVENQLSGSIAREDVTIDRYRPDLSFTPSAGQ